MRAAVLLDPGRGFSVEEVGVDAPAAREVLVRTAAAGVCHTDLSVIEGSRRIPVPTVLGHEASGVVEAVGAEVTHLLPGDHVVACLSVFCGACEWCLSGRPALCEQHGVHRAAHEPPRLRLDGRPVAAFGQIGAFAEKLLVHENALVSIDPAFPLDVAAVLGCAVVTGLGAVFHTARVAPGETVAVLGCGGVGLNCVQGALIAGASRVIAVDRSPGRLEYAKRLGATDTVEAGGVGPEADRGATETDRDAVRAVGDGAVEEVLRLTGGGVDHCFEAVGSATTVRQAFAMLRRGGTTIVVGAFPTGAEITVPAADFALGKSLRGCRMGSNRFRVDIPRYLELHAAGRLRLDELVSGRVPLERLGDALESLRRADGARTVVTFDPSK